MEESVQVAMPCGRGRCRRRGETGVESQLSGAIVVRTATSRRSESAERWPRWMAEGRTCAKSVIHFDFSGLAPGVGYDVDEDLPC
jgi:hypothetical protein